MYLTVSQRMRRSNALRLQILTWCRRIATSTLNMKTAVFLAASAAVLAVATPLNMEKRKMETEVVVEWKTVYVTQGVSPSIFAAAGHHNHHAPQATSSSTLTTPTFTPEPETVAPAPEPTTVAPSPDPTPVAPVTTTTVAPEPKIEPSPSETKAAAVDTPAAPVAAPPASSAAQDVGAQPTDYASAAVYHHNIHRLNYSSPALKWSDKHAGYAAETAAKCVFKHDM
jgi:outer membrane biosynthesis protein TonB